MQGTKELRPRWKRCVAADSDLGDAIGQKYVEQTFGAEGKARTLKMVERSRRPERRHPNASPGWATETKKQALVKLRPSPTESAIPISGATTRALKIVRGDALGEFAARQPV